MSEPNAPSSAAPTGGAAPLPEQLVGGCLCGQLRYSVRTLRAMAMVCHCQACQKQSGSVFSFMLAVPEADLQWQGVLQTHTHHADSGRTVHRRFCPTCGSPVVTQVPQRPGTVFLKAGTLDATTDVQPKLHLWSQHKWPWVSVPPGTPCLATQPELS
jgi:hypothetical protein